MTTDTRTQHTPGPWQVYAEAPIPNIRRLARYAIQTVNERWVQTLADIRIVDDLPAEANARLIAAAPDLLAALEELIRVAEPKKIGAVERIDAARAAIAKARGEE